MEELLVSALLVSGVLALSDVSADWRSFWCWSQIIFHAYVEHP